LRESVLLIVTGTLIGIPLSLAMSWTIRSQLFGIQPGDPRAMCIAVAIVFLFAIVASWVPTYRASRLDPVAALKVE
jgi:ABC-type antimicrobial peptide transport system permease subunit